MPITRTIARGSCRATLHEDDPDGRRVVVTITDARAVTVNPWGSHLAASVHLEPRTVRELHETLTAFLAGDDDDAARLAALQQDGEA